MGHFALRVTDTRAFAKRLADDGVELISQPRVVATKNGYVCNVKDPDGIAVELIDRISLFDV